MAPKRIPTRVDTPPKKKSRTDFEPTEIEISPSIAKSTRDEVFGYLRRVENYNQRVRRYRSMRVAAAGSQRVKQMLDKEKLRDELKREKKRLDDLEDSLIVPSDRPPSPGAGGGGPEPEGGAPAQMIPVWIE